MAGLRAFRSLSIRDYRLWFIGAFVSNVGHWAQTTAITWVVLTQLTNGNAASIGFTLALQYGPQLFLTPIAGGVADRFSRKHILLSTQVIYIALALVLCLLFFGEAVELWQIYLYAFLSGIVDSFEMPTRATLVSDLVPSAHIPNAVALNALSFNTSRLIGPAVAGIAIAAFGAGWVIAGTLASFIALLLVLLMLRIAEHRGPPPRFGRSLGLGEGVRYVRMRPDILLALCIVFLVGTFGMNFPIVASTMTIELGGGSAEYGALSTVLAVGSIIGALAVAQRRTARITTVIWACGLFGVSYIAAAFMPGYVSFALMFLAIGYCSATILSTSNGYIQLSCDPALRGRVLSLHFALLMGGTPLGAPLVGWIVDEFGARWGLALAGMTGILCLTIGLLWMRRGGRQTSSPERDDDDRDSGEGRG